MKLKKMLSVFLSILIIAATFSGCGSKENGEITTTTNPAAADKTAAKSSIYILTAAHSTDGEDLVTIYAKEEADEINKDDKHSAKVITSTDANAQIKEIEDLVAKKEKNIAVVIQPFDDSVKSAIQSLADANIPFVVFDKTINEISSLSVSNVKSDDESVGIATAAYFVENGLAPGENIYVYEVEDSSVSAMRNKGFTDYLKGDAEFDDDKISKDKKWSDDDLKSIQYSSDDKKDKTDIKEHFQNLIKNQKNTPVKWIYAQDDNITMSIIKVLDGNDISSEDKKAFFNNKPLISGCGGSEDMYSVLAGKSYSNVAHELGGLMTLAHSPKKIKTAIEDIMDKLEDKNVEQEHSIDCEIVTSDNVNDFKSFK